jgi:hypothetical protein
MLKLTALAALVALSAPAMANDPCPEALMKAIAGVNRTSPEYELAECRHGIYQAGIDAADREIQQNKLDDMENRLRALEDKDQ